MTMYNAIIINIVVVVIIMFVLRAFQNHFQQKKYRG